MSIRLECNFIDLSKSCGFLTHSRQYQIVSSVDLIYSITFSVDDLNSRFFTHYINKNDNFYHPNKLSNLVWWTVFFCSSWNCVRRGYITRFCFRSKIPIFCIILQSITAHFVFLYFHWFNSHNQLLKYIFSILFSAIYECIRSTRRIHQISKKKKKYSLISVVNIQLISAAYVKRTTTRKHWKYLS